MRRLTIFLGRSGTVLLAVGLALLLISLIPAAQMGSFSGFSTLGPNSIYIPSSENVLTPQQGLRINATANGTLNVYLLEVSLLTIYDWIRENQPEPFDIWNATYFEEFLEANPGSVGWHNEIQDGEIDYEYVPTRITNATLAFSNTSSDIIRLEFEISVTGLVAPRTKVLTLVQWTIPLGFVLVLPWLIDLVREKTR